MLERDENEREKSYGYRNSSKHRRGGEREFEAVETKGYKYKMLKIAYPN